MSYGTLINVICSISTISVIPLISAHVSLTFPPARRYDLDFLDNIRTKGPCGMPRGSFATTLMVGVPVNISWHLAYPHKGGYRLELLDQNDQFIMDLIRRDKGQEYVPGDPTAQWHTVTIPNHLCDRCTIRLLRQASEWANEYRFWSCADVRLVQPQLYVEECSGNGDPILIGARTGCKCRRGFWGPRCQYQDECESNQDCGNGQGICVDIGGTSLPRKQCFCPPNLHGMKCSLENQAKLPTKDTLDFNDYKNKEKLSEKMTMYYKKVGEEMEFVLLINGTSYGALGWRPSTLDKKCKIWPNVVNNNGHGRFGREAEHGRNNRVIRYRPNPTLLKPVDDSEKSISTVGLGNKKNRGKGIPISVPSSGKNVVTRFKQEVSEPEPEVNNVAVGIDEHPIKRNDPFRRELPAKGKLHSNSFEESSDKVKVKPEPQAEGESEPISEPEQPVNEPEPISEPERSQAEPEPVSEPAKSQVEPEPISEPEVSQAEPEPGSEPEKSQIEPEPEQTQAEPEPAPEKSLPEHEQISEPGKPHHPEPESEPETLKPEPHPASETEPVSEPEKLQNVPNKSSKPKAIPEPHTEPEKSTIAEPEPSTISEPEAESHAENPASISSEPEPEKGGNSEPESESQAEPEPELPVDLNMNKKNEYTPKGDFHPMDCTDIIIGAARGTYSRILDYYSRDRSTPRLDEFWDDLNGRDSITSATGWQSKDGQTILIFRRNRKLAAAEEFTDHTISGKMHVIWAKGQESGDYIHLPKSGLEEGPSPSIPKFYEEDEIKYHGHGGQRGYRIIDFGD